MQLQQLSVQGYRSLYDITIPLKQVTVITGDNGSGKSNLYKALHLFSFAVQGQFSKYLSVEGGMPSVLWAGERRQLTRTKKPVRMKVKIQADEFNYELSAGLPANIPPTKFCLDPEIKSEYLWFGDTRRKANTYLRREAGTTWVMDQQGKEVVYPMQLVCTESVLSQLQEPHLYPELSAMRESINQWRFYHHFRTDSHSPIRVPQTGIRTPVLDNEGTDLAAALQTIIEIGDEDSLRQAIDEAFHGSELIIEVNRGQFDLQLLQPGINRALDSKELSDGTLRYLCLVACLLSPRPPKLLALNEPETSLHPDLIEPLAHLIIKAAEFSQLWITTHSRRLVDLLSEAFPRSTICLQKTKGQTEAIPL